MKGRRKKVILIAIGVLVVAGFAYKMVLAPKSESKVKVEGTVYVMPKSTGSGDTTPPEGFGTLEEEPLVRQIVTDTLTGASAAALTSRNERHHMQEEIRKEVDKTTDVKTKAIVFSDLVVQ
jgi:flagellar FliL protein